MTFRYLFRISTPVPVPVATPTVAEIEPPSDPGQFCFVELKLCTALNCFREPYYLVYFLQTKYYFLSYNAHLAVPTSTESSQVKPKEPSPSKTAEVVTSIPSTQPGPTASQTQGRSTCTYNALFVSNRLSVWLSRNTMEFSIS